MFIVFDGIDGCGKSTIAAAVAETCRSAGREVVVLDHPTKTGLGAEVRDLLHVRGKRFTPNAEAFLYASDIRSAVETIIQPALDRGAVVICHRWWYSSVVYQSYIDRGDLQLVTNISRQAAQLRPDFFFLLTVDPEEAMRRIEGRGPVSGPYEKRALLSQTQQAWLEVFRSDVNDAWASHTFDTTHMSVADLHSAILKLVTMLLPPPTCGVATELNACDECRWCGGTGVVDSGGIDESGRFVNVPCSECCPAECHRTFDCNGGDHSDACPAR